MKEMGKGAASLGRNIGGKFVIQMLLRGDVKLLDLWMIWRGVSTAATITATRYGAIVAAGKGENKTL